MENKQTNKHIRRSHCYSFVINVDSLPPSSSPYPIWSECRSLYQLQQGKPCFWLYNRSSIHHRAKYRLSFTNISHKAKNVCCITQIFKENVVTIIKKKKILPVRVLKTKKSKANNNIKLQIYPSDFAAIINKMNCYVPAVETTWSSISTSHVKRVQELQEYSQRTTQPCSPGLITWPSTPCGIHRFVWPVPNG